MDLLHLVKSLDEDEIARLLNVLSDFLFLGQSLDYQFRNIINWEGCSVQQLVDDPVLHKFEQVHL